MKTNLYLSIAITATILTSCKAQQRTTGTKITLKNTSELVVPQKAITIKRSQLSVKETGTVYPILIYKNDTIPAQLNDLNGDGKWDELFLVTDFTPNEKKIVALKWSSTDPKFPIKTSAYFVEFFKKNSNTEFINYFDFPDAKSGWPGNNGLDRIEYYNFHDIWDYKIHEQFEKIAGAIRIQKRLGFKRKIAAKMPKLYGGSTYWSLSRECLEYVVEFTKKNKWVLNRFKYTLCAEEFYFQTIIMNSPFADKVINDNLRHIDWVARNGNNPAVLDETDLEKLKETNAVFARKFDYPQSTGLLNKIKKLLA